MKWTTIRIFVLATAVLGLACVCGLALLVGSVRYGGLQGLWWRVRMELSQYRPHPQFVPTPLPLAVERPAANTAVSPADQARAQTPPVAQAATGGAHSAEPTIVHAAASPNPRAAPDELSRRMTVVPAPTPVLMPTVSPTPTLLPTPTLQPVAASIALTGATHIWQRWNNCSPATLAMNLSYFGITLSQAEVAAALKPNPDDKNVSPDEMASFARSLGLHAIVRVNGNADRLRLLLSNGVPVLIETWYEREPEDDMGHYRLLTGYDEARQQWIAFDSFVMDGVRADQPYQGIRLSYNDMDRLWAVFNRIYIVIYSADMAPTVLNVLGEQSDDARMWEQALQQAKIGVEQRPDDPFAWFNLGTDLVAVGQFAPAATAYDRARVIGLPWRMLWYQFGPFRAYYETERYQELIALADATIATAGNIEEVYYWKGVGLAAQGNRAAARQAWQRAVELNPNYAEPAAALKEMDEASLRSAQPASEPGGG
jgi:tetratricopeptide (TPR) repeat protein